MKKSILLSFISIILFCACSSNEKITKEECLNKGMTYEYKTVLNYRTGVYEKKFVCTNK
ncbi:hypothetical protein [Halarcobacter sp.]|uniref:hypothetical protein n=1 Tax=Halarcobacter sp. TaxID=2321133 RepID=UPI002AA8529B|nr:hypothetical protein [Halarcobacter sp.]